MDEFNTDKIERLQVNLAVIRKVAGWSAEELAEMLGVTRQTIVNLENSNTHKMSKIQYIAIRALLEAEARSRTDQTLGQVIEILVDREDFSEESKSMVKNTITTVSQGTSRRVGSAKTSEKVTLALSTILGTLSVPILAPMIIPMMFAHEILVTKNKDKKI